MISLKYFRYEDVVTNPKNPFAFGITLSELLVESTDSNWQKAIVEDVVKIYKVGRTIWYKEKFNNILFQIVQLEGLAVYWNCNTKMYSHLAPKDMVHRMKMEIAFKNHKPEGYTYSMYYFIAM